MSETRDVKVNNRVLAFVLDFLIFGAVDACLMLVFGIIPTILGTGSIKNVLISNCIVCVLFILKDSFAKCSFGKMAMKLKIVSKKTEEDATFIQKLVRNLFLIISLVEFIFYSTSGERLGDKVAGTKVVSIDEEVKNNETQTSTVENEALQETVTNTQTLSNENANKNVKGKRIIAFVIDLFIVFAWYIVYSILTFVVPILLGGVSFENKLIDDAMFFLPLILKDSFTKCSPGKMIMKLKIVSKKTGENATFSQKLVRNLTLFLHILDVIVFLLCSERLGDMIMSTEVILVEKNSTDKQ